MIRLKNNHGFTLIEVVVTIVIMSVLMAIAVPSVMKYLGVGDEAKAIDEAYACVSAANYYGTRLYTVNKRTETQPNLRESILKKAQVNGVIIESTYTDYKVSRFVYKSPGGLTVLYENDKYMIVDDSGGVPSNVIDMMYALKNIDAEKNLASAPNNNTSSGTILGRTYRLQDEYLKKYDGRYPVLSTQEIAMLTERRFSETDAKKLRWKPIYDKGGNMFLVADSKTEAGVLHGAALGPLIYYDHQYYYFIHSYNQSATSTWLREGEFNPEDLKTKWGLIETKQ